MLSAYVDNELSVDEQKTLMNHVIGCAACAKELDYMKGTKKLFLVKQVQEPAEFFETRLYNRIENYRQPAIFVPLLQKLVPAIALVLLLVTGYIGYSRLSTKVPVAVIEEPAVFVSQTEYDKQIVDKFEEDLLEEFYS
jgi:anti-sigma factor RsiW